MIEEVSAAEVEEEVEVEAKISAFARPPVRLFLPPLARHRQCRPRRRPPRPRRASLEVVASFRSVPANKTKEKQSASLSSRVGRRRRGEKKKRKTKRSGLGPRRGRPRRSTTSACGAVVGASLSSLRRLLRLRLRLVPIQRRNRFRHPSSYFSFSCFFARRHRRRRFLSLCLCCLCCRRHCLRCCCSAAVPVPVASAAASAPSSSRSSSRVSLRSN